MKRKTINQAVAIALITMMTLPVYSADYGPGVYFTSLNSQLTGTNNFSGTTFNVDSANGIDVGTATFSNTAIVNGLVTGGIGAGTVNFTQGTTVNISAEGAIHSGNLNYRDSAILNIEAEAGVAGGVHDIAANTVVNINASRGFTSGTIRAYQGATVNVNATDGLLNAPRIDLSQSAVMNIGRNGLGGSTIVDIKDMARINATGEHAIDGGTLNFISGTSLTVSSTSGINAGTQNFSDGATLKINATGGVTGGTQVFNGGAVLEATATDSIVGGTQVFKDYSRLLIKAGATLSGGSMEFQNGASLVLDHSNTQFDLRGASLNFSSSTSNLFLGSGNTVLLSAIRGSAAIINIGSSTTNLIIDTDEDIAYSGFIGGMGGISMTKAGQGSMNFTGILDSGNTFLIAGGTFFNNGNVNLTQSFVSDGGTAGGTGVWRSLSILDGGTLAPGNSIGTMTVRDVLSFAPGSYYLAEVDDQGQADLVHVLGTAQLDGSLIVAGAAGNYVDGARYKILSADNGLTGTFHTVSTNLAFKYFDLDQVGNELFAIIQTTPQMVVGNEPWMFMANANQRRMAMSLAGNFPGPSIQSAMSGLTVDGALNAFSQLSGEIHASTHAGLIEDSDFLRSSVINRLANPDGNDVWMKVSNTNAFTGSTSINDGVTRRANAVLFGIDRVIGSAGEWIAGAVGGYGNTSTSTMNSNSRIDTAHLGAYVGRAWDQVKVKLGLGYAYHDVDSQRTIKIADYSSKAQGDYQAQSLQAFADIGYQFSTGAGTVEPFLNVAGVHVHRDSFREDKSEAALNVRAENSYTTLTTAGVRVNQPLLQYHNVDVALLGSVGYRNASGDITPTSHQSLSNGSVFDIQGNAIARNAVVLDIGLKANLSSELVAGIGYRGLNGDNVRSHTTSVYLNWMF